MSTLGSDERSKITNSILSNLDAIQSREDLADFVSELLDAYEEGYFEQQPVVDYLDGFEGLLSGMDNWYRNNRWADAAPDQPDWRVVGKLLHAAFYHS